MINFIIISGSVIVTLLAVGLFKELAELRSIKNSTSKQEN